MNNYYRSTVIADSKHYQAKKKIQRKAIIEELVIIASFAGLIAFVILRDF